MLPLKKESLVTDKTSVHFVLENSAGVTGVIADLLRRAAEIAIRSESERITLKELQLAVDQFDLASPQQ
jgi:hypothetical protein